MLTFCVYFQEADEREAKENPQEQRNPNQIDQNYNGQYKQ